MTAEPMPDCYTCKHTYRQHAWPQAGTTVIGPCTACTPHEEYPNAAPAQGCVTGYVSPSDVDYSMPA